MKRERDSDSDEARSSADATAQYGIYNLGHSFVRPPVVQNKPNTKRPRVGDGHTTTNDVPVKSEPDPERFSSESSALRRNLRRAFMDLNLGSGRRDATPCGKFKHRTTTLTCLMCKHKLSFNIHVKTTGHPLLGTTPQKTVSPYLYSFFCRN